MRQRLLVAAAAALLAGCQIPQDPDGTLDRVEGGTMRVGVTDSDPWVIVEGQEPSGGLEVELVRRFARDLDSRIVWVDGSEEELVNALKEGSLDLVIAGFTKKSRWKKDVAFTRPYVETKTVVGLPEGRSADDDLAGLRVAAELGTEAEALLERKTDAEVIPVSELSGVDGPAAAHDYVLDDLDLHESDVELKKEKHVMAVPFGENAWMVRLERFLLNREGEIRRLLTDEGKP
jgi:polar amino acid transport system substrate-binding protein